LSQLSAAAVARQRPKERGGARDKRFGPHTNLKCHAIGLMGELAVSRVVGVPADLAAYIKGDPRGDFVLHGARVEVKTLQGFLVLRDFQMNGAAAYVLIIYEPNRWDAVWIQGWATEVVFARRSFAEDFGHGPCKAMQPRDLYPIGTLAAWCLDVSGQYDTMARQEGVELTYEPEGDQP